MSEENKYYNDLNIDIDDEDTLKDRYLTFLIGNEYYAIDISYVVEIIGIQIPTDVPNVKPYIKGIINLRGSIIPIVDVRARFGMDELAYNERTCIIVINFGSSNIGIIVDEVADVVTLGNELLSPAPQTNKKSHSKFISNIARLDDKVVILLNLLVLLYDEVDSDLLESINNQELE